MSKGDVSQLTFEKNCEWCKHIPQQRAKYGKGPQHPTISRVSKFASSMVSRVEPDHLLKISRLIFLEV